MHTSANYLASRVQLARNEMHTTCFLRMTLNDIDREAGMECYHVGNPYIQDDKKVRLAGTLC